MSPLEQVKELCRGLDTPGLDIRLQLFMIRAAAWEAMCEIDLIVLGGKPLKLYDDSYTVDDL